MRYQKKEEGNQVAKLLDFFNSRDHVINEFLEEINYLLERGEDPNQISVIEGFEIPLISLAAKTGQIEFCDLLISFGANVDVHDRDNVSPLAVAAYYGKLALVKRFLEFEQDLELEITFRVDGLYWPSRDTKGRLLYFALKNSSYGIARLLLEKGVNPHVVNQDNKYRSLYLTGDMIELLDHYQKKYDKKHGDRLTRVFYSRAPYNLFAINKVDIEEVKFLLESGEDANGVLDFKPNDEDNKLKGIPLLAVAALTGSLELCNLFINYGAKVNAHNGQGISPLAIAVSIGSLPLVKRFLQFEQDIDRPTNFGVPIEPNGAPLYVALMNGHLDCAKLLIEKGAKRRLLEDDEFSGTASSPEMVDFMIKHGISFWSQWD